MQPRNIRDGIDFIALTDAEGATTCKKERDVGTKGSANFREPLECAFPFGEAEIAD